ncbi:MAG: type II toxin-antitoxin system Phd/YefM family antitoxin [Planctomycetes bacterium]|nr:type II toxin-antitoxin system Phd/YefM family antitoxin [Planctomycetota bacterium]
MKTYTYSEARQRLATLLDQARREGRVQIRRRDGQVFVVLPARPERSPLDVPGVQVQLPRGEILKWLRAGRRSSVSRLLEREVIEKGPARRARSGARRRRRNSGSRRGP